MAGLPQSNKNEASHSRLSQSQYHFRIRQSVLGRPCASLQVIHRKSNISPPQNLVTIRSNRVYRLSTNNTASDIYQRQNHHIVCISRKTCPKISITTSYQFFFFFFHKTCHSTKPNFEIIFIKFHLFRKYFKNRFITLVL